MQNARSRTNNTIRGATLIYGKNPYSLQDTNISLATDVCVTSWNTQRINAFDHALSGPFNSLHFHPALSSPDSL